MSFPTRRFAQVCVLGMLILPLLAAGTTRAELQLTEILADPASDWNGDGETQYRDDEWIEVTNTGPENVDLAAFYLRDGLGDEPHLNLWGVLMPGEAAVFHGSDAVSWQQANGLATLGFSLNNSGDSVVLFTEDPDTGEILTVDSYTYLAHEAEDDRASGRLAPDEAWALFDALNPYNGDTPPFGTGCIPSPGDVNDCVPNVADDDVTWGHLKADYR